MNLTTESLVPAIIASIFALIAKYFFDVLLIRREKNKIFNEKYFDYEIEKLKGATDCLKSFQEGFIVLQSFTNDKFEVDKDITFMSIRYNLLKNFAYIKANYDFELPTNQKEKLGCLLKFIEFLSEDINERKDILEVNKSENKHKEFNEQVMNLKDSHSITELVNYFNKELKNKLERTPLIMTFKNKKYSFLETIFRIGSIISVLVAIYSVYISHYFYMESRKTDHHLSVLEHEGELIFINRGESDAYINSISTIVNGHTYQELRNDISNIVKSNSRAITELEPFQKIDFSQQYLYANYGLKNDDLIHLGLRIKFLDLNNKIDSADIKMYVGKISNDKFDPANATKYINNEIEIYKN